MFTLLSLTIPPEVTASAGMDIVCHALESYTARWYTTFDRKQPEQRVTYCGSNPVSDLWCEKAMSLLARSGGVADEFTFTGGVAKNGAASPTTARRPACSHSPSPTPSRPL